jgi:hypothetical protein
MISNSPFVNFASGELSPSVWARSDRPFYTTGLEVMRNFIPLLTGGAFYRPGFKYINHTRLNRAAFLMSFEFNDEQSYNLEFTDKKLRIIKDGGNVLETAVTVTGVTQANPGVVTAAGHGYATGDEVYISGIGGMTELNGQFYLVTYIGVNTFSLTDIDGNAINTTTFTAFSSNGSVARVYEITTPYATAHLSELKMIQSADLGVIVHPAYEPRKLVRTGHAAWTLSTYHRTVVAKTITGITRAAPGVVTAVAHGFVNGDRIIIRGVAGMEEVNELIFLVVYIGVDTFSLTTVGGAAIDTTAYGVYEAGGEAAKIISATRTAITGITQANPGVITAANHGLVTGDKLLIFSVGGMTQLNENWYWATRINANTLSLTDETGAAIDTTAFGAWTAGGYVAKAAGRFIHLGEFPGAVGFYGGREWMGGSDEEPDVMHGSRAANPTTGASRFDDFTVGTNAADSVQFQLTSQNGTADRIRWFSGTPAFLIVGTFGGVYKANGGTDNAVITPTAIAVVPISSYGTADINPLFVGGHTVYVEVGARTLRSFEYDFLEGSYFSADKNLLADEITYGGITQIAFTQGRPDLVWGVRDDGTLLSCTFLSKEDVAGWARHSIGGDGIVLSAAADYRPDNFDRLLICVERTIDGHTRRYLEYNDQDPLIGDPTDEYTAVANETTDLARFRNLVFEKQKQFVRLDSAVILDTTKNVTLTLSALTGSGVTATAGSATFVATDVGKFIFIKYLTGDEAGVAEITGYTSSTQVTVNIIQDFISSPVASGGWYLMTTTVRGLDHLEGEVVSVLTDGGKHTDETVTNGAITLDYPSRYVIVGYGYLGFGRSLDLVFGAQIGVSDGRPRNIQRLIFKFRDTMGGKYGCRSNKLYKVSTVQVYNLAAIAHRVSSEDLVDRPPLLFSGVKDPIVADDWGIEKRFMFVQDEPYPMTVQAVIPLMDVTTE